MTDYSMEPPHPYATGPAVEKSGLQPETFSAVEVMEQLDVTPSILRGWTAQFSRHLSPSTQSGQPLYTPEDVQLLNLARNLLAEGSEPDQVDRYLYALRSPQPESTGSSLMAPGEGVSVQNMHNVLRTIADAHHTLLNSQAANRELIGVVVQDNFNLKDENRKLRERMLELERSLAEYQRREESRKERMESRLRALEGALSGLQQQIAQLVHGARRRRGWFW